MRLLSTANALMVDSKLRPRYVTMDEYLLIFVAEQNVVAIDMGYIVSII